MHLGPGFNQWPQKTWAFDVQRGQAPDLAGQQRQRDTAEISCQDGPGQKVGDEAKAAGCTHQTQDTNHYSESSRGYSSLFDPVIEKLGQGRRENGQGGYIWADDKLTR
jgi:hypothetical protein